MNVGLWLKWPSWSLALLSGFLLRDVGLLGSRKNTNQPTTSKFAETRQLSFCYYRHSNQYKQQAVCLVNEVLLLGPVGSKQSLLWTVTGTKLIPLHQSLIPAALRFRRPGRWLMSCKPTASIHPSQHAAPPPAARCGQIASDSSPETRWDVRKVCHSRLKLNHRSLRRCFHSSACPPSQQRRRRTWAAEGYIYKSVVMLPRRLRRGLPTSLHHCNLARAAETLKRLRPSEK